jgi:uncharacterized protein YndB with AHSA1/START domain
MQNLVTCCLRVVALSGLLIADPFAVATAGSSAKRSSDSLLQTKAVMTMKHDLETRERAIHWPAGFAPDVADLFSHNEGRINAPCQKVWANIINATQWPQWYPNSKNVRIKGALQLASNTTFQWNTFGIDLESRINEFVPFTRIGWYGYAPGTEPSFYHAWYLIELSHDACRVVTDEVGKGPEAKQLRARDEGLMHRGHDLWLASLKWASEKP